MKKKQKDLLGRIRDVWMEMINSTFYLDNAIESMILEYKFENRKYEKP